ncbi:MAG TPA: cytochrome c oxidase assembly protein [Anaerolineales bacterium]
MNGPVAAGWVFHPSVLIGVGAWTLGYIWLCGPLRRRYRWGRAPGAMQQVTFHLGSLVALLALISPLDRLGDEYLFSAHMAQHLLFLFAVAPLWLAGMPGWLPGKVLPPTIRNLLKPLTQPIAAALVFTGITLLWHYPAAYGLAQANEWLHILEHLTFIGAGLIGWWPMIGPDTPAIPKPTVPVRLLYAFSIALPCTLLGAIFTFAGQPIYRFYVDAPHPFGLGALEDQRLGGLLMWVPTHMIVLLVAGKIAAQWLESRPARVYAHQNLDR